ncbi:MAG: hypothetical protein KKB87_09580, partial [Alphaproteobacteria bacterium]|nr:hypothetical protein [Alphaproteobacteria bacterium]
RLADGRRMSRAMILSHDRTEPWLLDEETWDSPDRLSEADLYAQAGAGRPGGASALEDPEDDR